jgi:hypothetical protein
VEEFDNPHRQEPSSLKKLLKGDATWSTRKAVLGWVLDTAEKTLELPAHRIDRLQEILDSILPSQKCVSVQKWHKVLGELRSMSLALPGTRGLFSVLQEALRHKSHDGKRLRLRRPVHDFLDDFRWLAKEVGSRPTIIDELVAQPPSTFGATDASGLGMGGIFFLPGGRPYLWRKAFPHKVALQLVTADNPTGSVSISDLELAATVAQSDVLCQLVDVSGRTTHTVYDNMATVWWRTKGSTTTTGPAAYLLRLQAIHQRHHRYLPQQDFIPGKVNLMADLTTRSWDISDSALLSNFNLRFPQTQPWTICTLRKEIDSALTSALLTIRTKPESLLNDPKHKTSIGNDGMHSASKLELTRSCGDGRIRYPSSNSLGSDIAMEELLPAESASDLAQWKTPSGRLGRRFPDWGPLTSGKTSAANSTSE